MSSASPTPPPTPARKKVLQGGKRRLAHLAGRLLCGWVGTLRLTMDARSERELRRTDGPKIFVLWHNRLFIAGHLARVYRSGRPLHALISTSNDGAWLTAFFETMGLRAVRGSSSRGGREAVTELVQVLRERNDAGITPDGPRGPVYRAKPGALVVARRSGASLIVLGVGYESAWRLKSWDGFWLPRPFSRVHLVVRPFDLSPEDEAPDLARLEAALKTLNLDASDQKVGESTTLEPGSTV